MEGDKPKISSDMLEEWKRKDPKSYQMLEKIKEMAPLFQPHTFWDTQPVQKGLDHFNPNEVTPGPIEDKKLDEIDTNQIALPEGFEWSNIDIRKDDEAKEVYDLLVENYVEDTEGDFRFNYSIDFLRWATCPPKYKPKWHFGVRATKSKKLLAFISGIPVTLNVHGKSINSGEINFLCIHKKLRAKRLAPVLIKEVTRRINRLDIWQAVYTSGTLIPKPFAAAVYYHRSINYQKLIDVGFSSKPKNKAIMKLFTLPDKTETPGFRQIRKKEVKKIYPQLKEYLEKFKVGISMSQEEAVHYLAPRDQVIYSYVVEDPKTKELTDFISFYALNSSVLNNEKHDTLNAAYAYYYFNTKTELTQLFNDAIIMAKKEGFDVFNTLNIMDNEEVFEELRFKKNAGDLNYYLFNYKLSNLSAPDIGIVLV